MQQTPSLIEQIKTLYTNTNLPAALYGADGSVIWQNAAALPAFPAIPDSPCPIRLFRWPIIPSLSCRWLRKAPS